VPGVAILTSQIDPNVRCLLAESNIAAVYLDSGRVDKLVSNILLEYRHGIVEALEHLTGMGHRRIAYVGGPSPSFCDLTAFGFLHAAYDATAPAAESAKKRRRR
jgi:LacI family transcriptional regulator